MFEAAEVGDLEKLKLFEQDGTKKGEFASAVLQPKDELRGVTPLHLACEKGHLHVVEYLLRSGVDPNSPDKHKVTPLHIACIFDQQAIVSRMLDFGVKVDPTDVEGDTPLHWAATKGYVKIMEMLLERGANITACNQYGWTPLHRAAFNGRPAAINLLMSRKALSSVVTQDGSTPLHLACKQNQLSAVEMLLQWGARADMRDNCGHTCIDVCLTDGCVDLVMERGVGAKALLGSGGGPAGGLPPRRGGADAEGGGGGSLTASSGLVSRYERWPNMTAAPTVNGGGSGSGGASPRLSPQSSAKEKQLAQAIASQSTPPSHSPRISDPDPSSIVPAFARKPLPDVVLRPDSPGASSMAGAGAGPSGTTAMGSSGTRPASGGSSASGDDFQGIIKDEVRREAGRSDALLGAPRPRSAANKKFLDRYNLSRFNLFAP